MKYLAILLLSATLLSLQGCTQVAAPALAPTAAHATQQPLTVVQPHDPPADPEPPKRYIPAGFKVEGDVPDLVLQRFYRLGYLYPDVAKRVKRMIARHAGGKGWSVSYEATVIYVNVDKGEYVLADKLTEQFARRAYDHLRKHQPGTARSFRTWKVFAAWLRNGVR